MVEGRGRGIRWVNVKGEMVGVFVWCLFNGVQYPLGRL